MKKMTAQSRGMIYLALFVSGLVIATALLYFFTARNNEGAGGMPWVVIGIVAVAVLAFGFVFYIRARRTRYTRKLDQAYYAAYEHVSDIIQGSPLGMAERKEVLYDVLGLLYQAQQDGRPASDVVGTDVEGFVEKVQSSFGYRNRFLYHIMNGIQYSVLYLFFLQFVLFFEEGGRVSFFAGMPDISMVALMCMVSFLVMPLARYYVRRQNIVLVAIIPIGLGTAYIGILELCRAFLYHVAWVRSFLDGDVALIPSWGVLILWVALAVAAQVVKWLQRRFSIKRLT